MYVNNDAINKGNYEIVNIKKPGPMSVVQYFKIVKKGALR